MGEKSKRIGDKGEELVDRFLENIGWVNATKNFDIDSTLENRNTHGVDRFFSYDSPLITDTHELILISSKFSTKKYPNNPAKTFKSHYEDLGLAINEFKKSSQRNDAINESETHIENTFERGLLFWFNNIEHDFNNINQKLLNIDAKKKYNHDGIILLDNERIDWINLCIDYVRDTFDIKKPNYLYISTSLNGSMQDTTHGELMPYQYIGSNLIPFKVENDSKNSLILCSRDDFDESTAKQLISLARKIGNNLQSETILVFPDYNELEHEEIFNRQLRSLKDIMQGATIKADNYNNSIRKG